MLLFAPDCDVFEAGLPHCGVNWTYAALIFLYFADNCRRLRIVLDDGDVLSLHFVEFVYKSDLEVLHTQIVLFAAEETEVDCFEHAILLIDIRTRLERMAFVESISRYLIVDVNEE